MSDQNKDEFIEQILNEKVPIIEQEFITSSLIHKAKYDKLAQSLIIKFRTSPNSYIYYDVPLEIVKEFFVAKSAGSYFNSVIKAHYNTTILKPKSKKEPEKKQE